MDYTRPLKKQSSNTIPRPSMKMSSGVRTEEMKDIDFMTANLIVDLMNAATSFHKLHLQVTGVGSYAQHQALNDAYVALPTLADTVAEGYQGACELILVYPEKAPVTLTSVEGAIEYMREISYQIKELQAVMPHSEVTSNLDLIKDQINSTKYKLLFLS